jgi:hypothetical protein
VTLCFNCGAEKGGAYRTCQTCRVAPRTTADHIYSLLLTEHYQPRRELDRISKTMRAAGPRPLLSKEFLEKLGKDARRYDGTVGPLYITDPIFMDVIAASLLSTLAPRSFTKAKKIVADFRKPPPGIRHFAGNIDQLPADLLALCRELEREKYRPDMRDAPIDLLTAYFSEFAKAFPDERAPYDMLQHFIPIWLSRCQRALRLRDA